MIGYMADTYFWASSGLAPHLPLLVTNGTINTDGMKYLVSDSREYYDQLLLTSEEKAKENPFMQQNLLNLCRGTADLWDEEYKKAYAKMRQRCVTPANIRSAERNAADQIDNLLRSMGFENVKVRFDNTQTQDDIQHGNSQ